MESASASMEESFAALAAPLRTRLIARIIHDATIQARETRFDRSQDAAALFRVTELIHRLSGHVMRSAVGVTGYNEDRAIIRMALCVTRDEISKNLAERIRKWIGESSTIKD